MPAPPIVVRGPIDPSQVDEIVRDAESKVIAARPGAVPPHHDDGGHLPFGGSIGGTRGPSMFGKRKIVTSDADPNPQALLLNFPPKPSAANIINWEKNYRSNMYEDPSAEAVRFDSTNYNYFGKPDVTSYLADQQRSMGNLRRTANTRPTPSPAFYPPAREMQIPLEKCDYAWTWPEREKRPPPPRLKRCAPQRRRGHPPPIPALPPPTPALPPPRARPPRSSPLSLVTVGSSHASQAGGTGRADLLAGVRPAPTLAQVLSKRGPGAASVCLTCPDLSPDVDFRLCACQCVLSFIAVGTFLELGSVKHTTQRTAFSQRCAEGLTLRGVAGGGYEG
jgi:hypothetical protein